MVSGGRYPFERFTEGAKKALTLAQEEAERSHHSYIGTEHLLLGLLREEGGLAAKTLAHLGIEIGGVRSTIQSVLGVNERIIIQQLIPTSRVKTVIEASFEEARRMGDDHVGTEHLLLGLLIEGEGIAAHVLIDLGASLATVRGVIDQLHHEVPPEGPPAQAKAGRAGMAAALGPPSHFATSHFSTPVPPGRFRPPFPFDLEEIGRAAERLAVEQHTLVGIEHGVLAALDTDPLVGRMLAALGIGDAKIADLRRILTPPDRLVELRAAHETTTHQLGAQPEPPPQSGAARSFGQRAGFASLTDAEQDELRRLKVALEEAERRWRAGEELPEGEAGAG